MSDCNHDCSHCDSKCENEIKFDQPHKDSHIKKVIGVVSGKGGVGKSLVTGLLASKFSRLGFATAVLDADVTGPSVPKMFGINGKAYGNDNGFFPLESANGIKVMSANLLLETSPIRCCGAVPSSRGLSNSSGRSVSGETWITCSSICLRGRETLRSRFFKVFRLTGLSLSRVRRNW